MVGVHQFDQYLVRRTWRKPSHVDRIEITRVSPQPGQVIHTNVQMADSRRDVESSLSEHRYNVDVLHPPLDPNDALISRWLSGASTISLGGGSFLISKYGVAPRTSHALRSESVRLDV
jgi:hypothetical protein